MKKAIVSVFAKDARGITAYVTALLADQDSTFSTSARR